MTRMRDKKAFPPSSVASCVWSTDAVRVCTRWCVRLYWGPETEVGGECVLVYVCIQTDLILTVSAHWPLSGRQIFEDFRALRAQANFDSNFGKSVFTPMAVVSHPSRHRSNRTLFYAVLDASNVTRSPMIDALRFTTHDDFVWLSPAVLFRW